MTSCTTSFRSPPLRLMRSTLGAATALALAAAIAPAAAETPWFPMKVYDASSGTPKPAEYTPLPKAEKPYKLCVLFPHMKDSFWVAVAYGIVKQAEAMNVNMTLYEAGGYENLPKQLSQAEVDTIVAEVLASTGAKSPADMGKVMGVLKPKLAGKADMGKVSTMVKAKLAG